MRRRAASPRSLGLSRGMETCAGSSFFGSSSVEKKQRRVRLAKRSRCSEEEVQRRNEDQLHNESGGANPHVLQERARSRNEGNAQQSSSRHRHDDAMCGFTRAGLTPACSWPSRLLFCRRVVGRNGARFLLLEVAALFGEGGARSPGVQLVAALRHLSASSSGSRHLLLRANRRSPAFRPAIPRRHVVSEPQHRFASVKKRHSAARQRCGTRDHSLSP